MTHPQEPNPIKSFADMELADDELEQALRDMADDPQKARQALHQRQLCQAVARAMSQDTPPVPDALRDQVHAMLNDRTERSTPRPQAHEQGPVVAKIGRWLPAAVAAVLLIGVAVMWFSPPPTASPTSDLLPASMQTRFGDRHNACARMGVALYNAQKFKADAEQLPADLAAHFHQPLSPTPSLDLSGVGYKFWRAGECSVPGKNAVHLVYRSVDHPEKDTLSLWIKPFQQQTPIEAGKVYRTAGDTDHPVVFWRTGNMVYYLTADSPASAEQAAEALRKSF